MKDFVPVIIAIAILAIYIGVACYFMENGATLEQGLFCALPVLFIASFIIHLFD